MKHLRAVILCLAILLAAVAAFATDMQWTSQQYMHTPAQAPVQFFAPSTATALTAADMTVDLSNYILYGITAGGSGTCYYRTMTANTSAARAAATQVLVPVSTVQVRAKNRATPFLNLSGCTSGYLQEQ